MAIRDTLVSIVGGKQLQEERAKTQEGFNTLLEAWQSGPYRMTQEMLVERLAELDSSTIMYLIRQMQSGSGVMGISSATMEEQRKYQLAESSYQWLYSPLAQWSVNVWTSYGLGEQVTVSCNDEKAQETWEE